MKELDKIFTYNADGECTGWRYPNDRELMDAINEIVGIINTIPELKIRYHKELFSYLKEAEKHGNFVDLYTAEEVTYKKGEYGLINLGVSVECPKGYWFELVPRSSTFNKFGIIQTNSVGVIDTDYCGDNDIVKMPVYATRDITIPANTRICQFRLVKDIAFSISTVDKLVGKNRSGFGSTDKEEKTNV